MKASFEQTAFEAAKAFVGGLPNHDTFNQHLEMIEMMGWSRQEFDNEMLKRVSDEYCRMWKDMSWSN